MNAFGKHPCPCCNFSTLEMKANNTFQICPVCFWEDDGVQSHNPDYEGGANLVSLNQVKENYRIFGACEEKFKRHVRNPLDEELNIK
jgi:hypothetical protein